MSRQRLDASLARLRREALKAAAQAHGFRWSANDLDAALARGASLNRAMRVLARAQSADIRVGYAVNRLSRFLAARVSEALKAREG